MRIRQAWVLGLVSTLLTEPAYAQSPSPAPNPGQGEVQQLAQKIDEFLAAGWTSAKVQPASRADDAEFLRRVSLDLIGRIHRFPKPERS